jgi:chromosome segregation ATPase
MATFMKRFWGAGSDRETHAEELQPVLAELKAERAALESLLGRAETSKRELETMSAPFAAARQGLTALESQVDQVGSRVRAFDGVAARVAAVELQAEGADKTQRRVEKQLANATGDVDRMQSQVAELRDAVDLALQVREQLAGFGELGGQIDELRSRTDGFGQQLRSLQDTFGAMRGQHDEVMRAYKQATARCEAIDQNAQAVSTDVEGAARRVASLERTLHELEGVAERVPTTTHQLETLNTLAGYVTKKIAALEQQREAVDRAASQAANLQDTMRQIDSELERQDERAARLAGLAAEVEEVQAVHREVLERSQEVAGHQGALDAAVQASRDDLSALRDDVRKTVERFELENRGLDTVSQRIVDLRGGLGDFEERFRALDASRQAIGNVQASADGLGTRLGAMSKEVELAGELAQRVGRIEDARPAVEGALEELRELNRSREGMRDALEQIRVAHGELQRFREAQSDTQSWLAEVDQSLGTLHANVTEVSRMRPQVELLSKDVERVTASAKAFESRREFVEDLHRRLAGLTTLGAQLEERAKEFEGRMTAADQRFVSLTLQADQAERVATTIFGVTRRVEDAERRSAEIVETVTGAEQRALDVEALSERVRQVGAEVEQRQTALEQATAQLERASALRQEAAGLAQTLQDQTQTLTAGLATAEARGARLETLSEQLDERASALRFVEKRMQQFEAQLAKWELTDVELRRALDEVAGRQGVVDALRGDIEQLFQLAERTMDDVRSITGAREDVDETRQLLDGALTRLADASGVVERLEHRGRQIETAGKQLARLDALLRDLRSTIENLEGQRAVVDRVVEQAGVLEFQSKQAEALIVSLREERDLASRMQAAVAEARKEPHVTKAAS